MKRLIFSGVFFAVFFCLLCPLSIASAADENTRPLRVGLETHYPPFSFVDAKGERTGFDYDIAVALCANMGIPCEYASLPFDDLLVGIREGTLDFVVDGFAALESRTPHMDFTDTYYRSRTIYLGVPGIAITHEGLKGKKLGVQTGTSQEAYARANWTDIADIVAESYDKVLEMLIAGKLDVAMIDGLPGYEFLKTENGLSFDMLGEPMLPDEVLSRGRIAVRKNAGELVSHLNKALMAIRLNGEYDRINRKYFPFSIY